MKNVEDLKEEYHLVINSKYNGSFYVGLYNRGDRTAQFIFNRSPMKSYETKYEALKVKELFVLVWENDGWINRNNEHIEFNYDSYMEVDKIEEVKICKFTTKSEVFIDYL